MSPADDQPQPAIVIMAHAAPARVRRLIEIFAEHPIVVHYDAKAPAEEFAELTRGLPERVLIAPRHDCRLKSWSMVAAELATLRVALRETAAEHVAVISGTDYPLVAPERLGALLADRHGRSWLRNDPMPYYRWDTAIFHDGGMWRLKYRYLTRHDQMVFVRGRPAFVPIRRRIPADVVPTASEQWKLYCRRDAEDLLRVLDARPDLVRYGRSTYIPDETFVASLLASPRLFGRSRLVPRDPGAWLVNWPESGPSQTHPGWFRAADVPRLKEGLAESPMKLFARKFDPAEGDSVIKLIERELW